jgi:hypothetical protein
MYMHICLCIVRIGVYACVARTYVVACLIRVLDERRFSVQ